MKLQDIHIRDPFILVDNNKYYLYGTRGVGCWNTCSGFDVYISTDLENWSDPITVFEKGADFWADRQFWAPEVHKYKGKYYMLASFKSEGRRRATHILVSDAPDSTFVPLTKYPTTPADWECLDGTLYVSKKGDPYMVFCHEWLQAKDGKMVSVRLSQDLTQATEPPRVLFSASEPSWAKNDPKLTYVTDGPFLLRISDKRLLMIWSTYYKGNYVEACAISDNGEIDGNWSHCDEFVFASDGGHGMLFTDLNGSLKFIMHTPNITPNERPIIFDMHIEDGMLRFRRK